MDDEASIIELISIDALRVRALNSVASLKLPDWLIAAGFVRNTVWDYLFNTKTPLADIDVIYHCKKDVSEKRDRLIEANLRSIEPLLPWSVKNQARMHIGNGDAPYLNTLDAMSYWPEKQTCIGVRISDDLKMQLQHCFPLSLQFSGEINRNPKRSAEIFNQRIKNKGWLKNWPKLKIEALS